VYIAESAPALDIVPTFEFPPEAPLTLQVTPCAGLPALVTVAENVCEPPGVTVVEVGEIFTATPLMIATLAEAAALESACAVALTVTLDGAGRICGAVY
jgi:hypothetical protein